MNSKNINEELIISKKIYDCYLLYVKSRYYLFKPENNSYTDVKIEINEDPMTISNSINMSYPPLSDNPEINDGLTLIEENLKEIGITNEDAYDYLLESFGDLEEIIYDEIDEDGHYRTERFNEITDEYIINRVYEISETPIYDNENKIELTSKYIQFKGHETYKDGLYVKKNNKDGISYLFKGNILINSLIFTYDRLELFPPVVTINYTNTKINKETLLIKKPFLEIANDISKKQLIDTDSNGIISLLRKINIYGNPPIVKVTEDILKDGFFFDLKNNKVLTNNVFNDLNSTDEDIKGAIQLFNELIDNRGYAIENDCTLFRFMLWSPFAFCLKQLGFKESLYSMVLWGVTDTNKTGSAIMFSHLYTDKKTTLQKANTQSAIGTRLGENTFPLILDESKDNLTNPNDEEFNKNIVTDEIGRSVKDKNDNNLMNDFPALRMTIRTLNQDIEYKAEFLKRHKVLYYDKSMQIKEADKISFNKKYKPNSPNTPLNKLKHLGKAFADRFIPYIEEQSDELYNLEDLTIKILTQIQKEYHENFNLMVMLKQKTSNETNDTTSIIRNGLNKLFRKNHRLNSNQTSYMALDFQNSAKNSEISWLDYKPLKKVYYIKVSEFEKEISNICNEHIPILEVMKFLDIPVDTIESRKFKSSNVKTIELNEFQLTYKLFNINIYDEDELKEKQNEDG